MPEAFSVVSGVLTGFAVYKTNDNNLVLDKNLKDIVNTVIEDGKDVLDQAKELTEKNKEE